MQMIKASPLII